jgi:phenylalanyl-tRNA synthetase beta chain
VPPYRSDVTRDVDVIEDILRIYGYNQVPLASHISFSLSNNKPGANHALREHTASTLTGLGAFEMMSNPLTRSKYFEGIAWIQKDKLVRLLSSINTELDVMRPNMFWTGLESVALNINHKNTGIVLYEFGHSYTKNNDSYREEETLVLYASGARNTPNWHTPQRKGDFYYLKSMVALLLDKWGISGYKVVETTVPWLDFGLEYSAGKNLLARVGILSADITRRFDIKQEVSYAECYWEPISHAVSDTRGGYREIVRYPTVRRDLALLLDKNAKFSDLEAIAKKYGGSILQQVGLFDVYEGEKVGKEKKSYAISLSFRHNERTLTDDEVDKVMQKLVTIYQQEMGATLR